MNFSMLPRTSRVLLRKIGCPLLGCLYLSLSLYAISCAFHHDLLHPELHAHPHGHSHSHDGKSEKSTPWDDLYCKLVQKVGGAALILQTAFSLALNDPLQPFHDYDAVPSESVFRANLPRGPPSV